MDFIDQLQALSTRIERQQEHIQTEEATKTSFVLPFITCLGYDVFDPTEVTPELNADIGIKKGEKVDYAILQDGQPIILIECKHWQTNLDQVHASQLYRYFSVTDARVGILTNGIVYRFYSDLEAANRMDERPFLEIDLLSLKEAQVVELKRLRKGAFDQEEIVTTASDLKYTRAIRQIFGENVSDPSEDFVRFFASQVYSGRLMPKVIEQFSDYVRRAIQNYVNDRINDRLRSALETESQGEERPDGSVSTDQAAETASVAAPTVVTTDEELEGYHIVRAIMASVVDPKRIVMRDLKSYCGILLDDNNRKPICRLHFNTAQKYLGLFDEDKNEVREPIEQMSDIYQYEGQLRAIAAVYEQD